MVAEIQRSQGLGKALRKLLLAKTPEDRAIYEMARRVVNQVKALPDVPTPKSLDAPSGAATESGKVYRSEDGTPTSTRHSTMTFDGNQHTAANPSTTPADPSTSVSQPATYDPGLPVISAERSSPDVNEIIHLTIVDHATDEELDMIASPEDTLVAVTARYASILMRPHYNMTFSFKDGEKIPLYALGSHRFQAYSSDDVHCAQTLRTVSPDKPLLA